MIVPTSRLLFAAAVVMLPAATLVGLEPHWAPVWVAILTIGVVAGTVDAVIGLRRSDAFGAGAPGLLRMTKDVATHLPIVLQNRSSRSAPLRAAMVLPEGIASGQLTDRSHRCTR